jgi:hypothetical protein
MIARVGLRPGDGRDRTVVSAPPRSTPLGRAGDADKVAMFERGRLAEAHIELQDMETGVFTDDVVRWLTREPSA